MKKLRRQREEGMVWSMVAAALTSNQRLPMGAHVASMVGEAADAIVEEFRKREMTRAEEDAEADAREAAAREGAARDG